MRPRLSVSLRLQPELIRLRAAVRSAPGRAARRLCRLVRLHEFRLQRLDGRLEVCHGRVVCQVVRHLAVQQHTHAQNSTSGGPCVPACGEQQRLGACRHSAPGLVACAPSPHLWQCQVVANKRALLQQRPLCQQPPQQRVHCLAVAGGQQLAEHAPARRWQALARAGWRRSVWRHRACACLCYRLRCP